MRAFVNVFADKPFVAAAGAFIAALLASLGLADLSSSAVTVVDAVAGLVVTIYVGGSAHVAAQTAKAAPVTPSPQPPTAPVAAAPAGPAAPALVAGALETAAAALRQG